MIKTIEAKQRFLWLPIKAEQTKQRITFSCKGEIIHEFQIPMSGTEGLGYDYFAPVPIGDFTGDTIVMEGDFTEEFYRGLQQCDEMKQERKGRPFLHFTPDYGWINDPNGLIYDKGVYHLYFQYNPFDTVWENMCWGHAVSKDLLHWKQLDTVLYPDETGTVFSGSGIVNEKGLLGLAKDNLLFFYTAAGSNHNWSAGKSFTQRVAYSEDGGKILVKTDKGVLDPICKENRDPKVFWHEPSKAYIMSLWLEKNEFCILRSEDLECWECSQRFELDKAWECPDLIEVPVEGGGSQWIFWSADGFYFLGSFDGYTFQTDGIRKEAYITTLTYAAQTYSGVGERVISVPWIRTKNMGKPYTGSMGLPRELLFVKDENGLCLKQSPLKEFEALKKQVYYAEREKDSHLNAVYDQVEEAAIEICLFAFDDSESVKLNVYGYEIAYDRRTGLLKAGNEEVQLEAGLREFSFLFDQGILEMTAKCDTIYGVFEMRGWEEAGTCSGEIIVTMLGVQEVRIFEIQA